MAFAGGVLSGWEGRGFATTAHARALSRAAPSGTGIALSAPFLVPADALAIRFRIAGGRYPEQCCLNLVVEGKTVRTATGESPYRMQVVTWDVTDLRGKSARLEIRDALVTGSHAYVHVDDIRLFCQP